MTLARHLRPVALGATILAIGLTAPLMAQAAADAPQGPITVAQVNAAQQGWCDGLLDIARTHAAGGDYKSVALGVLSSVYNYDHGRVLFKPTLTYGDQTFRLDRAGAAAYFIGGDPNFPNDGGFALKPWVACRYANAGGDDGVLIDGEFAFTMGNVFLTDASGNETVVDKFFAFRRGDDNVLRIVVHKSALPNQVPN